MKNLVIKLSPWLIALLFYFPSKAYASFQSGIGVEMAFGYPQMSASFNNSEARYNGFSVHGQLILPLLDYNNNFSMDLTTGYRYTAYQNTASTNGLSEWARMQGFYPGVRFNLKYFFMGSNIEFLRGRHLVSGNSSRIYDYSISPIQAYIGAHLPVGKVMSLALSYSQYLTKGQTNINAQDLAINEQVFMLAIQIDLGVGFFNVIKEDSSFELREDYQWQ